MKTEKAVRTFASMVACGFAAYLLAQGCGPHLTGEAKENAEPVAMLVTFFVSLFGFLAPLFFVVPIYKRERPVRFRLRTMLIATAVVAAALGLIV